MSKVLTALLFLLFVSCTEEKVQPELVQNIANGEIPAHESWNSKIIFTDEGNLKAILFTDHLKKYEMQKQTFLDGVKIDFYDKEEKVASRLTSLKGKVDDITRDMYAIDSVVAVNDSGTVLRTDELMWRNKDQKIITDKFVSIKSSKEVIEGYGLESDQGLHNYVIFKPTYSATLTKSNNK
ncbi:MAG: LPS export ABC transporter periplasmic protein LptC [Bacteroidota bacterium]